MTTHNDAHKPPHLKLVDPIKGHDVRTQHRSGIEVPLRTLAVLGALTATVALEGRAIANGINSALQRTGTAIEGIDVPKPAEANRIFLGDRVQFTDVNGKTEIRRVGLISDITAAATKVQPELSYNAANDMLERENGGSSLVHIGDSFEVPKSWGLKDIGP